MPSIPRLGYRNLPLLLLQAREALMAHHRPALREHGLSDQQWRVLRVLHAHADGLETGRLAEQAYLLGPSLTGMLARMQKSGLVTRQRDSEDARRSVVRATALGLALVEALSDSITAQYHDLEQHLGRAGLAALYASLDRLIALPPRGTGEASETSDACAAEAALEN